MPTPTDSDRRKARDAALRAQDEAIAEHLADAMRSGELQSAPSFGKPLDDADGWNETPTEFRMPFRILRNAGFVPPEVGLFHERATLRQALAVAPPGPGRTELERRLSDLEQKLALRLEGMRASGSL